ncbi:right-handed parallel beta-helix repeat-containing protein [Cellulomonas sp. Sa3CUA2]|uniref:Right-handed parallel beta-helix repeat-containing protein n=1 Tax=Cellulomonas avistercoris TaxID=2762242 RepID=A0ABR8QB33_9CELL|nr:right-handed parallel beta-helix repeat-containing protein [Cellulomonas avistercoris]MBD7917637.1 right-handed parallel beta-helix repeat-containing protein [Cellulomonas avistercoris]
MRRSAVLSVIALVGGSVLVAAPAHAAPAPVPGCGAVLTADARLTADLTCPEGDGLVLAEGVTLDLRGHTLSGSSGAVAVVLPSLGDVTIRNGTIAGWGEGMRTFDTWDEVGGTVTVSRVTFSGNGEGVNTSGKLGSTGKVHEISRSTFTGNGTGVGGIYGGAHVVRSTFTDNGTALGFITGGFLLEDSRLEGNGTGVSCDESGCRILRSRIVDNGVGVDARQFGADIADSVLQGNDTAFSSFLVWGLSNLERNTFKDNGTAVTLSISNATLTGNVFRGNTLAFTSDGGAPDFASTLVGNRFVRNVDAVVVEQPGTSLQDNVADHNQGWGIYAPGATDLGGNQARGNGNEPQCVGVVCGSRPQS